MKKIPSALKWMAEKRARVDGQLQAVESTYDLICGHVQALEHEYTSALTLKVNLEARISTLKGELGSLDGTVRIFDPTIDPSMIGPVHAWRGKYGKRGALRAYVAEVLKERAPEYVSTPELAVLVMVEFGLQFDHWRDRHEWYRNSLRGAAAALEQKGLVERSENFLGVSGAADVRGWRWKQEGAKTLAGLRETL